MPFSLCFSIASACQAPNCGLPLVSAFFQSVYSARFACSFPCKDFQLTTGTTYLPFCGTSDCLAVGRRRSRNLPMRSTSGVTLSPAQYLLECFGYCSYQPRNSFEFYRGSREGPPYNKPLNLTASWPRFDWYSAASSRLTPRRPLVVLWRRT